MIRWLVIAAMILVIVAMTVIVVAMIPVASAAPAETVVTVFLAESWTDEGWNMAHKRGWDFVKSQGELIEEGDLGYTIEFPEGERLRVNYVTNVGYGSDIESRMRSAISSQRPDMVFGSWWNAKDAIASLAPEYPNIKFEHCSGYPVLASDQFTTQNVSTYFVRMYHGDYQVGKIAGWQGHNKIGVVATYPIPEPVRGFNAFTLGLQAGLRESGYDDEVEVKIVWIFSWLNREAELLATEALLDQGYEVIKQGADTPTTAQTACAAGAVTLGYGSDTLPSAPCTVVTNEWDWGKYYFQTVRAVMDGVWEAHDYYESGTKLIFNDNVPIEVQADARAIPLEEVWGSDVTGYGFDMNGERYNIVVPAGSMTDEDLLSMQWWVDGVYTSEKVVAEKTRFAVD